MPVHPRWRGEQKPSLLLMPQRVGSSPLARGTDSCRPAAALREARPVHPRWRGEQLKWRFNSVRQSGSSPLARGTDSQALMPGSQGRFIPAGAGNRRPWERAVVNDMAGSSPLARGTVVTPGPRALPDYSVHPRWRGEQARGPGGSF